MWDAQDKLLAEKKVTCGREISIDWGCTTANGVESDKVQSFGTVDVRVWNCAALKESGVTRRRHE